MVEEQQVSSGFRQFESADPCMVDTRVVQCVQVQMEIMRQQRPDDVAMGHKHVGFIVHDLQGLFDRRHGTLLHLT